MEENNEVKVEESDEVVIQDFNEVKVEDSDEVIVQDSSEIITQEASEINTVDSNEPTYQEVNEVSTPVDTETVSPNEEAVTIQETVEVEPKKNAPVTLIIILVLIILGVAGYFVYDKYFKARTYGAENYTKAYYDMATIKKEKITKEEFTSRVKKYFATCGVLDQKDDDGKAETCNNDNWYDYVAYIDNGTPYYMNHTSICDKDGACTDDENHFEVYNFSEIKNVKKIASKVDQKAAGPEFAYQLNNGDVYYFTGLFEYKEIDGVKSSNHIVKVDLPAKLKAFSNVSTGQVSYGTEIVLLLENNEKYVLEYDYDTNKIKLTKYEEYYEMYHKFDDAVPLSADEKTLKLSSEILYTEKLNDVLKNNKLISDNLDDQEYEGICPQITVKINNKDKYFSVSQIVNTKVFLYTNNDNADEKMIEVYGLTEGDELYYAKFYAVDYEDPKNHSLELKKYSIKNVVSMALIVMNDQSNMLTDDEEPAIPYNYAIFKTKDGKYYTDYSYDKDKKVLREVRQDEKVVIDGSYTYNKYKIEVTKYDGGGDTSKIIVSDSKNKKLYENTEVKTFIGKNLDENKPYIEKGKLYFISLGKECFTEDNGNKRAYLEYYSIDLDSSTIKATQVNKTKEYIEGNVGKCKEETSSNTVDLNITITEKKESEFLAENAAEAAQYENVSLIDLDNIKQELSGKTEYFVGDIDCNECDETAIANMEYAKLKIDGNNVVYDVRYTELNSDKKVNTKFIIKNIPNPHYVYGGEFGGEDSYPVKFYVQDKDGTIYIVSFTIRTNNHAPKSIIKLIK